MNSILKVLPLITKNEEIVWYGKPHKGYFILSSIFNYGGMLSVIIVIGAINVLITLLLENQYINLDILICLLIFIYILLPSAIRYTFNSILCLKRYENVNYMITNRAVYITDGLFKQVIYRRNITHISHINIKKELPVELNKNFDFWAIFFSVKKIVINFKDYDKQYGPLKEILEIQCTKDETKIYQTIQNLYLKTIQKK